MAQKEKQDTQHLANRNNLIAAIIGGVFLIIAAVITGIFTIRAAEMGRGTIQITVIATDNSPTITPTDFLPTITPTSEKVYVTPRSGNGVNLRILPNKESATVTVAYRGELLELLEPTPENIDGIGVPGVWLHVQTHVGTGNDFSGWIDSSYVERAYAKSP